MHFILGLTQSFNSNYFCTFCRCNKDEARYSIYEDANLLRTPENYENDLATQSYGLKERCMWHNLKNFHITRNLSCDVMHDIWEGICRYDFGHILYNFICIDQFFTLETLNNRIQFYNFLNKNNPSSISKSQLLKKHIIISASEMSSFAQNFSLIIGDLIPIDNRLWEMYLVLEIIDIFTSKVVCIENIDLLRTLISEHHTIYIEFFGKLTPKHHFLIHYPGLLSKISPLNNVSSIRFEGKHRQFKATANVVSSRKNILYTLTLKNQLVVCHRLLAKNGFKNTTEFGSDDLNFVIGSLEHKTFEAYINFNMSHEYFAATWIKINGIKYSFDIVVVVDCVDFLPVFGVIRSIIIKESTNEVYFILNKLKCLCFNEHFHAYEIDRTEELLCKE